MNGGVPQVYQGAAGADHNHVSGWFHDYDTHDDETWNPLGAGELNRAGTRLAALRAGGTMGEGYFARGTHNGIVIFDGATGTWLQQQNLTADDFVGIAAALYTALSQLSITAYDEAHPEGFGADPRAGRGRHGRRAAADLADDRRPAAPDDRPRPVPRPDPGPPGEPARGPRQRSPRGDRRARAAALGRCAALRTAGDLRRRRPAVSRRAPRRLDRRRGGRSASAPPTQILRKHARVVVGRLGDVEPGALDHRLEQPGERRVLVAHVFLQLCTAPFPDDPVATLPPDAGTFADAVEPGAPAEAKLKLQTHPAALGALTQSAVIVALAATVGLVLAEVQLATNIGAYDAYRRW